MKNLWVFIFFNLILGFKAEALSADFLQKEFNRIFIEDSEEAPEYKQAVLALPLKLKELGFQNLGSYNLTKLEGKLNGITIRENHNFVPTVVGTRITGMYDPRKKALVVNTALYRDIYIAVYDKSGQSDRLLKERAEPFLLHEALGASGINDIKYDMSIGAYFLTKELTQFSPEESQVFKNKIQQHLQNKGGGTTTVGGGGNTTSQWIKIKLMEEALLSFQDERLFFKLFEMNIEGIFQCESHKLSYRVAKNEISYCESEFWLIPQYLPYQLAEFRNFLRSQ